MLGSGIKTGMANLWIFGKRAFISREAVIKMMLRRTLDEHYLAKRSGR